MNTEKDAEFGVRIQIRLCLEGQLPGKGGGRFPFGQDPLGFCDRLLRGFLIGLLLRELALFDRNRFTGGSAIYLFLEEYALGRSRIRFRIRQVALLEGKICQQQRDRGGCGEYDHQRPQPAAGTAFKPDFARLPAVLRRLPIRPGRKGAIQETALRPGQRYRGAGCPGLDLFEPLTAQQETVLFIRCHPLCRGGCQRALQADIFAAVGKPSQQSRPFAQQGLMRDLDGGGTRGRIPVECQETVAPKGLDHQVEDFFRRFISGLVRTGFWAPILRQPLQLSELNPSARVLDAFSRGDQPQKDLPGRGLAMVAERLIYFLRAAGECAGSAADALIGGQREHPAFALLE